MKKLLILTITLLITTQGLAIDGTYHISKKSFYDCFGMGLGYGIHQFVSIPEKQTQYDGRGEPVDSPYERGLASECRKILENIIDTLKNHGTVEVKKTPLTRDNPNLPDYFEIHSFDDFVRERHYPGNVWHMGVMLGDPRFVIASGLGEVHDPNEKIIFKQYSPLKDDDEECSFLNATALELAKKEIRIFEESAERYNYTANCHIIRDEVRVKSREKAKVM